MKQARLFCADQGTLNGIVILKFLKDKVHCENLFI